MNTQPLSATHLRSAEQLRDAYLMAIVAIHHDAQAAPGAPRFAQLDSVAQVAWIYAQLGEPVPTNAPTEATTGTNP